MLAPNDKFLQIRWDSHCLLPKGQIKLCWVYSFFDSAPLCIGGDSRQTLLGVLQTSTQLRLIPNMYSKTAKTFETGFQRERRNSIPAFLFYP